MGQSILSHQHRKLLLAIAKDDYFLTTFYFTGGTALAEYYLQHRYSEDLDFFTEKPLEPQLESHMKVIFASLKPDSIEMQTLNEQRTYFIGLGKQMVKLDVAYYPFAHLGEYTRVGSLRVASLRDITVNKVQAIMSRKRGRDYVDLYLAIKKQGLTADDLIKDYRLKFDIFISKEELAKQFLGVMEALDQPKFLGTLPWSAIERYFIYQAKALSIVAE